MICIPPITIKWLIIASMILHLPSYAEQFAFSKDRLNEQMHFKYTWNDQQEQTYDLAFVLPLQQINNQHHKNFNADLAQQYVYIELHKAARKIDPKEARVQIQRRGQDIQVQVTSRSDNLLQKWQRTMGDLEKKAHDQYLEDNHYIYHRSLVGQKTIKPDHLRYISENTSALLPIAQALYASMPSNSETGDFVKLVLSWVQSIPYNELKNRLTSNGTGYLPPLSVVANNQGDCDSKTVLMAGLVRSLYPSIKMTMVYLHNHALLGMELPSSKSAQTLQINGLDYWLMEPTGPAKIPLGEVAKSSARDIAVNQYTLEQIP